MRYDELFKDANCVTPFIAEGILLVYAQYTLMVEDRDGLIQHLKSLGIPLQFIIQFRSINNRFLHIIIMGKICQSLKRRPQSCQSSYAPLFGSCDARPHYLRQLNNLSKLPSHLRI